MLRNFLLVLLMLVFLAGCCPWRSCSTCPCPAKKTCPCPQAMQQSATQLPTSQTMPCSKTAPCPVAN